MRSLILAPFIAVLASTSAFADCKSDVVAAFDKQRKSPAFRMSAEMVTVANSAMPPETVKMTVDYMPPDRMHQTVEASGQPAPIETVLVGSRAWATQGGGFEELRPEFAQSVVAHVKETLVQPPVDTATYECLGKVSDEGKDYVAYLSVDPAAKKDDPTALARTVYIDAATGLPAKNVVASVGGEKKPVFTGRYSYPTDIKIDAIEGAPVATSR